MNPSFITGNWNITILQNAQQTFNFLVDLTDDGRASGDIIGNYALAGNQFLLFGSANNSPIYMYGLLDATGSLEGITLILTNVQVPYAWKGVKGSYVKPTNFVTQEVLANKKFRKVEKCCDTPFAPTFDFRHVTGNNGYRDVDLEMVLIDSKSTFRGAYLASKLMETLDSNPDVPTLVLFEFTGGGEVAFYGGILYEFDDSPTILIKGIRAHKSSPTAEVEVAHFELTSV